jgi:hypothetical protein
LSSVTQSLSSAPSDQSPSEPITSPTASNLASAWPSKPKDEEASHHLFLPLDTRPASLAARETPAKPESVSNGANESLPSGAETASAPAVSQADTESTKSSPPKRTLSELNDDPDVSPKRVKLEGPENLAEANASGEKLFILCESQDNKY